MQLSKWRPLDNCLYVIPDIHGMYNELELILSRILPLRRTGGQRDMLVFLGDYIDRRADSHRVVDLVMEVKEDTPDQVVTILGNHEMMLLEAIDPNATLGHYNMWMNNGGSSTMGGYLKRAESDINDPFLVPRKNIDRWIPKEHIEFFKSLVSYYETEEYIFVHGGCDPFVPLSSQPAKVMAWDRSVYHQMWSIAENGWKCPWQKTIVTGHNGEEDGRPFVYDKFMMLDGSYAEKLFVFELNSKTGFSARSNKKRLVKEPIT
jgi:serine/threonine protein phosphatase 1